MDTKHQIFPNQLGAIPDGLNLQAFIEKFQGQVLQKGAEAYDQERKVWNGIIDKHPYLIAQCSTVTDVVTAVNFARENKLLLAVRSGGHQVAGNATCDDGIIIDLSAMKTVSVDPVKKIAAVQGGATWADFDRATQAFGLTTPGGVVSETGVAGLTLSGGLSNTRRKFGMSLDNLISAEIVLASGEVVRASEQENADLFWAIRGAGGNFGIVTSFEFKLHEFGPEVFLGAVMYPLADAATIFEFWLDFIKNAPNEITMDIGLWTIPPMPAFPAPLHHQAITLLVAVYAGPADEGESILAPMRSITTPLVDLSQKIPYTAVQSMFDAFFPKYVHQHYWKSLYMDELPPELIENIIAKANQRPSEKTLIFTRHLGGAISAVPSEATAFGDRSAQFLVSVDSTWENPADAAKNIQWTRDFWNELLPYSKGQTYFGFAGDLEENNALVGAAYGKNFERLVHIKTKYDPNNLFRLNQNIKPKAMAV